MRFGSFVFSISSDRENDHRVIDDTLREVELAEEIGMDAVWLTEHHFDGAVAYADPLVFGAAVAARTKRVSIGFAVVEMALHDEEVRRWGAAFMKRIEDAFAAALTRAKDAGEIDKSSNVRELAQCLVCVLQGINVMGKAFTDGAHIHRLVRTAMAQLR